MQRRIPSRRPLSCTAATLAPNLAALSVTCNLRKCTGGPRPPSVIRSPDSDPYRTAKAPGGIVRFRAVVIQENGVEAAITKESAAEFSDGGRSLHPARRFRIEIPKFLQLAIL